MSISRSGNNDCFTEIKTKLVNSQREPPAQILGKGTRYELGKNTWKGCFHLLKVCKSIVITVSGTGKKVTEKGLT